MLLKNINVSKLLLNLVFFLFFAFAITFFLFGSTNFWDTAGHISAGKTIHDYFWPDYTGWNFDYLMGFQQGLFYPPVVHYLLAALMFFLSPEIAGKLLISILIILLPISMYYFSIKFYDDKKNAQYLTLALVAGWFLIDKLADFGSGSPGGGVNGTLEVGLIPAFLTIHLMFFFLGSLLDTIRHNKNWKIPAVILAISLLTHFTAYFFIILTLIFVIIFKEKRKTILKILIFSIGLSAFWWMPFFYNYQMIPSAVFGAIFTNQLLLLIIVTLIVSFLQKDNFSKIIAIFCMLLISIWTISKVFEIPFQFFRLQPIVILLIIIPLFNFIKDRKKNLTFPLIILFLLSIIFIGFTADLKIPSFSTTEILNPLQIENQVLILNDRTYLPHYHSQYIDFVNKTGLLSSIGLFSEASLTSYLNCNLTIYFDEKHDCWGVIKAPYKKTSETVLKKQLSSLNISYIISRTYPNRLPKIFESELYLTRNIYYYDSFWFLPTKLNSYTDNKYITRVWDTNFIEIPNNIDNINLSFLDWVNFSNNWFDNEDNTTYFLSENNDFNFTHNGKIKSYNINKNKQEINIVVDANTDVPILIKQNWSPNWNAYTKNGEKLTAYISTPFSTLIFGHGEIILKNELTFIDLISRIISIIVIILLLYYRRVKKVIGGILNKSKNKKES